MTRLIGDRDGEVKVLSFGWTYGMYIDVAKANDIVNEGHAVIHNKDTIFLMKRNYPIREYIKEKVIKRDGRKCKHCSTPSANLHRSVHKLLGGKVTSVSNYIVCCKRCANEQNAEHNKLLLNASCENGELHESVKKNKQIIYYYRTKRDAALKKSIKTREPIHSVGNTDNDCFVIYCDASYDEYRKKATIGYVIKRNRTILYVTSDTLLEIEDNNLAELKAIEEGLNALKSLNINKAKVMSDSITAVKLLKQNTTVEHKKYKQQVDIILDLQRDLEIAFKWIPRKQNKLADKLSKGKLIAI